MGGLKRAGEILGGIVFFILFVLYWAYSIHAANVAANNLNCPKGNSVQVNYFGPLNGPPAQCAP